MKEFREVYRFLRKLLTCVVETQSESVIIISVELKGILESTTSI